MVNIDILKVLNEYYTVLRKSCGTFGRSELNRLCLIPLLKDMVDGPLTPYVTDADESFIDKYIKDCFSSMITDTRPSSMKSYYIYIGTSNSFPSENVILNSSARHSSTESRMIGKASKEYFWIAMPTSMSLGSVENTGFKGDYIPLERFHINNVKLNGLEYRAYYVKSIIPLYTTYSITIKRN